MRIKHLLNFFVATVFIGVAVVSYTHLDVYKRQVDYLPEQAFLNVGTLEEAIEKAKNLLDQAKT